MVLPRDDMPGLVRELFETAVPDHRSTPLPTVLHQEGELRLGPDRPWMPFTATQRFHLDPGGFVWRARVRMAPLVTGIVEDAYEDGKGRLDVKVWSILPVAHARGLEVDRGEAERYLAELAWNPMAFAYDPALRYRAIEDGSVRVWRGEPSTYVDLRRDVAADELTVSSLTRVRAKRPEPWGGRLWGTTDFGGLRAPRHAEVYWDLPTGRFVYFRCTVTSLGFAPRDQETSAQDQLA